jgi:uncharacterized protein (TIGR03435 family)
MSSDTETGKLAYSNVNLKDVIGQALKVQQFQITGPEWLEGQRFDIVARFTPRSTGEEIPLMLQSLLADRFRLTTHRETKELPVYALTAAKNGPRLKTADSASGISSNSNRTQRHAVAKVSMERFAEFLTGEAGRPVLNKTGLTGIYEMKLDWAPESALAGNDTTALPSLFTALQEQLGLRLQSTRGAVEMVVVDHVDGMPTQN